MKPAEEYILNQPELYRDIILNLQVIIEKELPDAVLLFKWKIPYYYLNDKPFCFLNASHKGKYVDLAFNKGYQLQQHLEFLVGEKRNTFKSLRYFSIEDINVTVLKEIISEAKSLH
ncbi:DUF1801 domain-containing protein [Flavobacterium sp.]|jgi:hypothetical protein|uniref:DUF1801 domain-containing protein n=1 Tax=Flavobacterium sp. TaxID=239 RepID=UPI0037C1743B